LTSQTLATEIKGNGSRAAAETHRGREKDVNASDRVCVEHTMSEFFAWITEVNVAGAAAPTFEFYEEAEARKEWVEVIGKARSYLDIPKQFAHERLQIPMPEDGEEVIPRAGGPRRPPTSAFGACPSCGQAHDYADADDDVVDKLTDQASRGADGIIEGMVDEVRELLERVDTLEEFRDGLTQLYSDIDETRLGEYTAAAMMTGMLAGVDEVPE
jgi:phage gp29-like protein